MSDGLSSLSPEARTLLEDLPPSSKLVYLVLLNRGETTQQQLADATLLSPRTTRHAVAELEDAGLVGSRPSYMDARQSLYSPMDDPGGDGSPDRSLPLLE